ncbi:uncharacterized protein LOC144567103 [Carex rostrata]
MQLFNDFISDAGLVDTPIKNRKFTWTSKRPDPVFSKIDRVLTSAEWTVAYPVITLEALEILISDHTPLLLSCKGLQQQARNNKFECFWFNYEMPRAMVQNLWNNPATLEPLLHFHKKTKMLHKALSIWQKQNFGVMQKELQGVRDEILRIDKLEEQGPLDQQLFLERIRLREKAFQLANNIEIKWRQRSRCNWLAQGDRNTRFFHAMASSRLRRNLVLSIEENGSLISEQKEIMEVFALSMQEVLGTSAQVIPFDASALYPTSLDLSPLEQQFTLSEIEAAVRQLANNKASGPDGLPNEFLKIYWNELKLEILGIMSDFYHGRLNLQPYNEACIVMVPKLETPLTTADFRPISVLNLIPKLISKILSNRLRRFLPDLISPNQTAFVHGRQISENFVATRELLHHVSQGKFKAVFLKVDFRKAFDSVEWDFLKLIMAARGFPPRWIRWMAEIRSTSTSTVRINGMNSAPFKHRRGLRQGDPLSPMLFDLAVDVFQCMINATNQLLQAPLSNRIPEPILALQYADDTAVLMNAEITTLVSFKLILRLFSMISGLQVNFQKSTFIPINLEEEESQLVGEIISFRKTNFPVQYLGMPLTIKRPTRSQFMPLIEKVERKLQSWQSKLISKGGRHQLVKSVLSALPTYFMQCFLLPKWVIERIDRARRSFLWGNSNRRDNGISLCNWEMATLPTEWGGLGLPDLHRKNISLLVRWWWKGYTQKNSLWGSIIIRIRWQGVYVAGPNLWSRVGSFFWVQLISIKHYFHFATSWVIGNGSTVSYWYDNWGIGCLAQTGTRQIGASMSVRQAAQNQALMHDQDLLFNDERDELQWNWGPTYSAKTVYALLMGGGRIAWSFKQIWKYRIPPTVRIFIHLLLSGKILTRDVMQRRNFNCPLHCELCNGTARESAIHLFFECNYAIQTWSGVVHAAAIPSPSVQESVQRTWSTSTPRSKTERTKWSIVMACTCWNLWKQRNKAIFEGKRILPDILAEWIVSEATLGEVLLGWVVGCLYV